MERQFLNIGEATPSYDNQANPPDPLDCPTDAPEPLNHTISQTDTTLNPIEGSSA